MDNLRSPKTFWQTIFAFTFVANLIILIWSISRWIELKVVLWRSIWAIPLLLYLAVLIGCVFLFVRLRRGGAAGWVDFLELERFSGTAWRVLCLALFILVLLAIPYLKFTFRIGEVVKKSTQDPVLTMIVFYWVIWWLVLLAVLALKVAFKSSWSGAFAAAMLGMAIAYELFTRLQVVSTYPFSLGWSEASRFYYGSLYFAPWVYGIKTPLSTLHPTRYLLQSLPFLLPGSDLVTSRFWQFFLWIGLTGATALVLAWKIFSLKRPLGWLFAGWFFLFLLRVGVYYHLEPMVILPLLFVSAQHPWRSLAAVLLASIWAGLSRVNWFPMPALLACAIYFLEQPFSSYKDHWRYLAQPALWVVAGLGSALAAQALYIPLSGNAGNAAAFASSFRSDLLWDRLWPNDTFALGVLPGILIVSGPLLIGLLQALRGGFSALHPLRRLALFAMLIVLFAGGLVVSVKIGGGGDLHNMDAYAVLLGVVTAYFIGGKAEAETGGHAWGTVSWPIVAVALIIPLVFLVPALSPFQKFDDQADAAALEQLKSRAEAAGQKGPVLFISERQLLTFHQIDLPLVPEYESVTLMEMAMSNNLPYLRQFYADLQVHRFAAIVAGKQNVGVKDEGSFADENNVWNARVSPYILCYYQSVAEIETEESHIEFFVPRAEAGICP